MGQINSIPRFLFQKISTINWIFVSSQLAILICLSTFILSIILSFSGISTFIIIYYLNYFYVPKSPIIKTPLYIDFSSEEPTGIMHLVEPNKQWKYTEVSCRSHKTHNCKLFKKTDSLYMKHGIKYDIIIDFELSKSNRNFNIGAITVKSDVVNLLGEVIASSSRPLVRFVVSKSKTEYIFDFM